MSASAAIRRIDAAALRTAGRKVETPFRVDLAGDADVVVHRLLRVLPGKRIVGEGEWQGRRVLVKLFVAAGSARHWAQEKTGIEALRRAQLPTPELLLAEALPSGGHVLLTRFLERAQTLAEAWAGVGERTAGTAAAFDILRPAFAALGALHASGLVHEDLHLGNFLRCADTVFIIDGDAVRSISPGSPLAAPRAVRNLSVLLAQLPRAWDGRRGELLEAYRSGGGSVIADAALVDQELLRARTWRLDDYLDKTLRECTLFSMRRSAFRFAVVRRDEDYRLQSLVAEPDAAMARGVSLKDGNTSTVARVDNEGATLVVKRYNFKNLWHLLGRFWRPTRAWHSWREGHRLCFLGIATPAPLALVEERFGPLRGRGFLVNAYCPGVNLLQFLDADRLPDDAVARAIIDLFTALHDLRISHGDLKATNLLWHEGQVFLIDLDALAQHASPSRYERAWRRDRSRLLRNWPATSVLHRWLDKTLPSGA